MPTATHRPTSWRALSLCACLATLVGSLAWTSLPRPIERRGPLLGPSSSAPIAPDGVARQLALDSSEPATSGSRRSPTEAVAFDSGRWIEGVVEFPNGHDGSEPVRVIARGAPWGEAEAPTREYKGTVGEGGRFRVAFATATTRGELLLESSTLYLPGRQWIELADHVDEVVLRPQRGGLLRCCIEPVAGDGLPSDLIVSVLGTHASGRARRERLRPVGDGAFEAWQLPPGSSFALDVSGSGVLDEHRAGLCVTAGEVTTVVLTLRAGLRVELTVVDDLGVPVKRFEITATPLAALATENAAPQSRLADNDAGTAGLTGLTVGEWSICVAAPGHASRAHEVELLAQSTPLRVTLNRAATLAGQVLDPDGRSVQGATVRCTLVTPTSAQLDEDCPQSCTDREGRFELTDVPAGELQVTAYADGFAPSTPIDSVVAPGETIGSLALRVRRCGAITGRVVGAPGALDLVVVELASNRRWSEPIDADGGFSVANLVPGEFELSLTRDEAASGGEVPRTTRALSQRVAVDAGRTTPVTLRVASDTRTSLCVVLMLADQPLVGARVECSPDVGDAEQGLALSCGTTDTFGRVALDLPREAACYVLAVTSASGTVARLPIRVRGLDAEDLALRVPIEGIRGRVVDRDGRPHDCARIELDTAPRRSTRTDAEGRFTFAHVGPGRHLLAVDSGTSDAEGPRPTTEVELELTAGESRDDVVVRLDV